MPDPVNPVIEYEIYEIEQNDAAMVRTLVDLFMSAIGRVLCVELPNSQLDHRDLPGSLAAVTVDGNVEISMIWGCAESDQDREGISIHLDITVYDGTDEFDADMRVQKRQNLMPGTSAVAFDYGFSEGLRGKALAPQEVADKIADRLRLGLPDVVAYRFATN